MSELAQAERERIERLLGSEAGAHAGLETLGADELRTLRGQLAAALAEHDRERLDRLAALGGKLPAALVASLGQRLLGALEPELLGDVAEALAVRGDWTTMGGALDRLGDEHIRVAHARVGEDAVARALARCHDPARVVRVVAAAIGQTR